MTDLSVIIPARNEKYLNKTIESILGAIEADTEIIVILDGSWPVESIPDNPRVNIIHYTEARGQRQGINAAARIARGKFLMKLDAHCAVGPGFDRIIINDWQPGWTMVPTMYNLDAETFTPKLHKKTTAMYIGMSEGRELRAEYYNSRPPKFDKPIHETMCCMGPGWFLSAEDFWKQGGCDEGHGSWGQQGVEVSLKAWLSGGALMCDENTWFAHWFRGGGGPGFPYPISGRDIETARKYSRDLWLNDKWPQATRKLKWLVEKFNPPGWENYMDLDKNMEVNSYLYYHMHTKRHYLKYRGEIILKMPSDLLNYHQVIWETKPDLIIEIGTKFGTSAQYFQDQLDLVGGGGKVVTVDISDQVKEKDPRITYLIGNSNSSEIRHELFKLANGKKTMLVIDGNHRRVHVKNELHYYSPIVSPGCYMVVEDCYSQEGKLYGPGQARDWFLTTHRGKQFEQTHLGRNLVVGFCIGGWLRRK